MNINEIEALVRPNIRKLCPYSTARDEYKGKLGIFLDANESPYPTGWNRYPDPRQLELREKLAGIKGVGPENIFFGNGSDEAIDLMFRIFCVPGKDNAVAIAPSYGMYKVSAEINDIEVREVVLNGDFSLPSEKLLKACDANTKLLFLCSPNNPSGNAFPKEGIMFLIKNFNGIVIVDEAYVDFSSVPSLLPEIESCTNLVVFQTFSKARGLAGLRLGLAFSNPYVIKLMLMVKYPYNINASTQKLALEALGRPIDGQVAEIVAQRARIAAALPSFSFVEKVFPSDANFILVKVSDADALYSHLIASEIIVRNRNRIVGCSGCLRITIGLPEENDKLLKSLSEYEKGNIRR